MLEHGKSNGLTQCDMETYTFNSADRTKNVNANVKALTKHEQYMISQRSFRTQEHITY